MKEDEEETQGAPVEVAARGLEIGGFEEGCKELEQGQQKLVEGGPAL